MKVGCVPRFPAQGCTKEGADESGWFIKFCSVNCLGKVKKNVKGPGRLHLNTIVHTWMCVRSESTTVVYLDLNENCFEIWF